MQDPSIDARFTALAAGIALAGLLAAGCEHSAPSELDAGPSGTDRPLLSVTGAPGHLDADARSDLVELMRATAPYHQLEQARADGWEVRFPEPCLTHSDLGGMGQHLLNPALLDDEVAVAEPEFLVYEPGPADQLRLVAVEYVVPFTERSRDADPPTLFGHHFHPNETFGVWALHVWAWRHNPDGIFAHWNPDVSCEHADDVRTLD